MVGSQSGLVIWATSTSPSWKRAPSATSTRTRTTPEASPGTAGRPCSNSSWVSGTGLPTRCRVVIGRVCTIQVLPPAMAHSVSCGEPACRSLRTAMSAIVRTSSSLSTWESASASLSWTVWSVPSAPRTILNDLYPIRREMISPVSFETT